MLHLLLALLPLAARADPGLPVLLIPGVGGSRAYAKLDRRPEDTRWYCQRETDWYTLWLTYDVFLLPTSFECFGDNAILGFDPETGFYSNQTGVQIAFDPPGSIAGIEYLDDYEKITYFGDITKHLKYFGYNSTYMKGLSYDWRVTPSRALQPGGEAEQMTRLVEQMARETGRRVVIVSHSMGGLLTQLFLEAKSEEWKSKFISSWASIATPLFGAAQSYATFISGDDLGHQYLVNKFKARRMQITWAPSAWLLPQPKFWHGEPVITTPTRNYTATHQDYEQFFKDINYETGKKMYDHVKDLLQYRPPNVEVHCFFGTGVKTNEAFIYEDGIPDKEEKEPTITFGDGDGTVNLKSAKGCLLWQGKQPHDVIGHELPGTEHVDTLKSQKTIGELTKILKIKTDV